MGFFPSSLKGQTAEQKGRHTGCDAPKRFIINICVTLSLKISLALHQEGEEACSGVCVAPQLQRSVPPDHGSSVEQGGRAEAAWAPASQQ